MAHQEGALLVLTLLCLDSVLRGVRGDGVKENDQPERRYALIGAGVGLFLAIMFVAVKLCMIKRHMLDNGYHSAGLKAPGYIEEKHQTFQISPEDQHHISPETNTRSALISPEDQHQTSALLHLELLEATGIHAFPQNYFWNLIPYHTCSFILVAQLILTKFKMVANFLKVLSV
ncbi:transmembrane protein 273-like isoform X2 [Alosa sapidissima]|uniref:transmembrane protein 273-like isoform X2 n=1 Tax=Alosa sapidissima TaxID=34773 RepID=UPI001C088238|nr:transmembrane protein 273-like isoform X2 [Alosa sapidissima]